MNSVRQVSVILDIITSQRLGIKGNDVCKLKVTFKLCKEVVSARQTYINMATRPELALWINMAKPAIWLTNAKKEFSFILAERVSQEYLTAGFCIQKLNLSCSSYVL